MAEQLQINIGANTADLEAGLNRSVTAVGKFDAAVKKTTAASGQANQALVNLGRVASDAPFGFIAIQNNIEPLIQAFGSLKASTGTTGGALKALASSLAGPTGVLLAFSVVSSAVTVAIQKYGSLGGAVNALFGNYDKLDEQINRAGKSLDKYNEQLQSSADITAQAAGSVQGEATRVQTLAKIVQDQTASYDRRNAALKELQSISKENFGLFDIEKGKLEGLTGAVQSYTQSLVQAAVAKGFEKQIGDISVQLNIQRNLYKELEVAATRAQEAQRKGTQALPGLAAAQGQAQLSTAAADATKRLQQQGVVIRNLEAQLKSATSALEGAVTEQNKIVAPTIAAAEAARKQAEADREATKQLKERAKAAAELEKRLAAPIRERFTQAPDIEAQQIAQRILPERQGFEFDVRIPDEAKQRVLTTIKEIDAKFAAQGEAFRAQYEQNVASITSVFNSTLAPAIDAIFQAFEKGDDPIKALGQSVKRLAIELAASAVKAAALQAILGIFTGGGSLALGGVGALGGGGGIGGILSGLLGGGIGRAAAPSFAGGAGLTAAGMNLSGNVVFTQRGTDLVGVLNAGNARINRVG